MASSLPRGSSPVVTDVFENKICVRFVWTSTVSCHPLEAQSNVQLSEKSAGRNAWRAVKGASGTTTEAFALLLFANNHKAWLCDEKLAHGAALCVECHL
jgi:hypothetical protein